MSEPLSSERAVVIAGGGPTGMMPAAELALAEIDVAIVERRPDHVLVGSRAGAIQHTMTQAALQRRDERMLALVDVVSELAKGILCSDAGCPIWTS